MTTRGSITRVLATLGLIAIAGSHAAAQDKSAVEKLLIANEHRMHEAIAKADKNAFTALVMTDGWSADGNGIRPVTEFLPVFDFLKDQFKVTSWTLVDPRVHWVDANTAIVTYTWTGTGTLQGQPLPEKVHESTVWTKRGDRWVAVYHQDSEPPRPAKPATPRPTSARVGTVSPFVLGRPDAPLTMIEFTDLQCPYCRQFATATFEQIKKDWIDTGRLRYISRDFPLETLHPHAMASARAARCAGEQGKFWEMRWTLMRHADRLSPEFIKKAAAGLKLKTREFASCEASAKFDDAIQADMKEGAAVGITGTPTFVLGRTTGSSLEGPMVVGALPYAEFDARLTQLLALK